MIVACASEAARRSTLLGAILVSLPLTSILAITWLYRDTHDTDQVASLSWSILWVIVPSLVFFVALPVALRAGLEGPPPGDLRAARLALQQIAARDMQISLAIGFVAAALAAVLCYLWLERRAARTR